MRPERCQTGCTSSTFPLAALPGAGGVICASGMLFGLMVDTGLSPVSLITAYCGDGGLYQRLAFHTMLMPFAHIGMVFGIMLCGACRTLSGGCRPAIMLMWFAAQAGLMAFAECVTLLLFSNASLFDMMLLMAGIMIFMDAIAALSRVISARHLGS
ncbi:MAG: hypothetical protein R3E11_00535 [Sphingobium sp.]|jgi:hypothetical protein|nr:hypothetical protein [Sphingobium sp.]MCP5400035.1 hypothetical protein [Sphingomonas sp.]